MSEFSLGSAALGTEVDLSGLKKGLDQGEQHTKSAFGKMGGIAQTALGFVAGGLINKGIDAITGSIGGLVDGMVNGNAQFETYTTQFGVLLGSADAAKDRLADLADFGAKTPFELPELVEADKVLTAFGLDSADTAKRFGISAEQIRTTIGDVASGTGVGFKELSLTFGKFASGATGEAIARFQELGIATREEMAGWGLEFNKAGQLMTPAKEAFTVLESHVRQKFGGMMDAQSRTFEGMLSNLQDWIGATLRKVGQPIFELVRDKLSKLLEFLGSPAVQDAISGFAQLLANGIGRGIEFVTRMIDRASQIINDLREPFNFLVGAFYDLFIRGNMKDGIESLGIAIDEVLGPMLGTKMGAIGDTIEQVGGTIVSTVQAIGYYLGKLVDTFRQGGVGGLIQQLVSDIGMAAPQISAQLGAWGQALVDWIAPMIPPLLAKLFELWLSIETWIFNTAVTLAQRLPQWAQQFIAWIGPLIPPFLAKLGELATQLWDWISTQAAPLLAKLGEWAQQFVAWIVPMTVQFLQQWPTFLNQFLTWIGEQAGPLLARLGDWALQFIGWIAPMIPGFLLALAGVAAALLTFIGETVLVLVPKLLEWAGAFLGWIGSEVLPKLGEALGGILTSMGTWITKTALPWIGTNAKSLGTSMVQALKDGISSLIGNAFDDLLGGIKGALNGVIDFINSAIDKFNAIPGVVNIPKLGRLALGTLNFAGGLALVGEYGPELVALPAGSRVWPASETAAMLGGANYYIDARGSSLSRAEIRAEFETALRVHERQADARRRTG